MVHYISRVLKACQEIFPPARRVENTDDETFGMLFIADIVSFEELHSEIESILVADEPVGHWTYPLIQPKLLAEAQKRGY